MYYYLTIKLLSIFRGVLNILVKRETGMTPGEYRNSQAM